jgi:MFS family permease
VTRVLLAASLVSSLAYAAGSVANFWLFLLSQLFVGLGTAVGFAPLTADISHWFRRRRGLAVAIVSSAGYLSGVFWTTICFQSQCVLAGGYRLRRVDRYRVRPARRL